MWINLEQLFKAKKVAFRVVFRLFAKFQLFARKTLFRENPVSERNSQPFWSETHFSGSGPPKNLPERCVYKGFYAGAPKVTFWTQKCTFWSRNAKKCGIPHIFVK